jgi:hypothetical protein
MNRALKSGWLSRYCATCVTISDHILDIGVDYSTQLLGMLMMRYWSCYIVWLRAAMSSCGIRFGRSEPDMKYRASDDVQRRQSMIFLGVNGNVIALDRATGQEVWRSALKGSGFVNVVLDQGELYATTQGEVFRLDPSSGGIHWNNRLPGMGRGLITVASAVNQQAIPIREMQQRDEIVAAADAS